jgi:hypothetical protein
VQPLLSITLRLNEIWLSIIDGIWKSYGNEDDGIVLIYTQVMLNSSHK